MTVQEKRIPRVKDSVRKLLDSHDLHDDECRRCGFRRRMIVSAWIYCGEAPRQDAGASSGSFPKPGTVRPLPRAYGSGSPTASPELRDRLPAIVAEPELRDRLLARARGDDVSISEVMRRALRRYLGLPE